MRVSLAVSTYPNQVKYLHLNQQTHSTFPLQEFISEVSSMASCRHRHIVAPKGVHASENHCVVVYEYIPNGSVDDHLFSPRPDAVVRIEKRIFLDWPQRLKIALGTARGLAYLHEVREVLLALPTEES